MRCWPWKHQWQEILGTREHGYFENPLGTCVQARHRCRVCGAKAWRHPEPYPSLAEIREMPLS